MGQYFQYGEKEIAYLKGKDKRLAEVIDKVGMVERRVIPDLFTALVHSIVGQQISTKAHETIWRKMVGAFGEVTPQKYSISRRKHCRRSESHSRRWITYGQQHKKSCRVSSISMHSG